MPTDNHQRLRDAIHIQSEALKTLIYNISSAPIPESLKHLITDDVQSVSIHVKPMVYQPSQDLVSSSEIKSWLSHIRQHNAISRLPQRDDYLTESLGINIINDITARQADELLNIHTALLALLQHNDHDIINLLQDIGNQALQNDPELLALSLALTDYQIQFNQCIEKSTSLITLITNTLHTRMGWQKDLTTMIKKLDQQLESVIKYPSKTKDCLAECLSLQTELIRQKHKLKHTFAKTIGDILLFEYGRDNFFEINIDNLQFKLNGHQGLTIESRNTPHHHAVTLDKNGFKSFTSPAGNTLREFKILCFAAGSPPYHDMSAVIAVADTTPLVYDLTNQGIMPIFIPTMDRQAIPRTIQFIKRNNQADNLCVIDSNSILHLKDYQTEQWQKINLVSRLISLIPGQSELDIIYLIQQYYNVYLECRGDQLHLLIGNPMLSRANKNTMYQSAKLPWLNKQSSRWLYHISYDLFDHTATRLDNDVTGINTHANQYFMNHTGQRLFLLNQPDTDCNGSIQLNNGTIELNIDHIADFTAQPFSTLRLKRLFGLTHSQLAALQMSHLKGSDPDRSHSVILKLTDPTTKLIQQHGRISKIQLWNDQLLMILKDDTVICQMKADCDDFSIFYRSSVKPSTDEPYYFIRQAPLFMWRGSLLFLHRQNRRNLPKKNYLSSINSALSSKKSTPSIINLQLNTPLFLACRFPNADSIKTLQKNGFDDVNEIYENGTNPLFVTLLAALDKANSNDIETVIKTCQLLVDMGCDVTKCDHYGQTVLHLVARIQSPKIIDLIDVFCDLDSHLVNCTNNLNQTPLDVVFAAGRDFFQQCIKLLENGGKLSVFDPYQLRQYRYSESEKSQLARAVPELEEFLVECEKNPINRL
ncbi:MAG: hypothetical protein CMF46_01615 [Legionellales bacterium]|nr:hypothetical protein [Legionellales bacterium]|tara:strand:- start:312 stop:2936 length:2625 start_codon:yes stop_codon:yes gene_type:complete